MTSPRNETVRAPLAGCTTGAQPYVRTIRTVSPVEHLRHRHIEDRVVTSSSRLHNVAAMTGVVAMPQREPYDVYRGYTKREVARSKLRSTSQFLICSGILASLLSLMVVACTGEATSETSTDRGESVGSPEGMSSDGGQEGTAPDEIEGTAEDSPADPAPEELDVPPTDGDSWTIIAHDEAVFGGDGMQFMNDVARGGPGLVAVGGSVKEGADSAAVWTSTDGMSWERVPHDETVFGGERALINSVAAAGPGLVAVGGSGGSAAVWTSTDGMSWERVPHDETVFGGEDTQVMYDVVAGGPGVVAVGRSGDVDRASAAIWTSSDGLSWQRVQHDEDVLGGDAVQLMASAVAGSFGIVAVGRVEDLLGAGGLAAVWVSEDGLAWRRVPHDAGVFGTVGSGIRSMYSVSADEGKIVAVGSSGPTAAAWAAEDPYNWTAPPRDEVTFGGGVFVEMTAVTTGGPGFVAVGRDLNDFQAIVWTSVDGLSWERVEHDEATFGGDEGAYQMFGVTAGGPGLVAVGSNDRTQAAAVWTSP